MQAQIPQVNPKASYEKVKSEIDAAVLRVLESGWYLQGQEVNTFEAEFAEWNNLAQMIGVGNGTDALALAIRALGIGAGDEVIAPTHTATATIAAIELAGAIPVMVDINAETYTLDPKQVEAAITSRTRAIIPVHIYGHPADMESMLALAKTHNLKLIEDCAQAHGAAYRGQRVGSMGDIAAFSFYPTKNLAALGDGGAVGCNDPALATRARAIAQYGWHSRYVSDEPGMNTRLDEIQAAVLRCKLRVLDEDIRRRIEIADRYTSALSGHVDVPARHADCVHVYHLYVVRHPERDALRQHLNDRQIGTGIHYPLPVHLQPAYRGRLAEAGDFPVAEQISQEILSLPLYPELTDAEVDRVIEAILAFPS